MGSIVHNRLNVDWLNEMTRSCPEELVARSEQAYQDQIDSVCRSLTEQCGDFSILLVSGPSASAKTTTAETLSHRLQQSGVHAVVISLDNFFVERARLPRLPDGSTDYESVHTLDLPLLDRCFEELLQNGESDFPVFDFTTGGRSPEPMHISINRETIVILEGIHALHPAIVQRHDPASFRKVYISPNTEYFLGEERLLGIRELRLIRRIVRDHYHRANPVQGTLEMWGGVVASEVVHIIPYREGADHILDSAILYEPNIFEPVLTRLLQQSEVSPEFQPQMNALMERLHRFAPLDLHWVPESSVLREFLQ